MRMRTRAHVRTHMHTQMNGRLKDKRLRVLCATWNMGAARPPANMSELLCVHGHMVA